MTWQLLSLLLLLLFHLVDFLLLLLLLLLPARAPRLTVPVRFVPMWAPSTTQVVIFRLWVMALVEDGCGRRPMNGPERKTGKPKNNQQKSWRRNSKRNMQFSCWGSRAEDGLTSLDTVHHGWMSPTVWAWSSHCSRCMLLAGATFTASLAWMKPCSQGNNYVYGQCLWPDATILQGYQPDGFSGQTCNSFAEVVALKNKILSCERLENRVNPVGVVRPWTSRLGHISMFPPMEGFLVERQELPQRWFSSGFLFLFSL